MPGRGDPTSTVRWAREEFEALEADGAASGERVGSIVRRIVRAHYGLSGGDATVPGARAPAASQPARVGRGSSTAADPPASRERLDGIVAERLGGDFVRARRAIRLGEVRVAGEVVRSVHELVDPQTVGIKEKR